MALNRWLLDQNNICLGLLVAMIWKDVLLPIMIHIVSASLRTRSIKPVAEVKKFSWKSG